MSIKTKFGKRIKELRKRRGYSQEQLAEMLGIAQNTLSKIELGENFLTADTLEKLINALEVSPTELFDFEHHKEQVNLLEDIENYVNAIKNDKEKLIVLHKITQALAK